jgi:hypothetical protein
MKFTLNKLSSIISFTSWYLHHQIRQHAEGSVYRDSLDREIEKIRNNCDISYFNKLTKNFSVDPATSISFSELKPFKKTGYTFDLMRIVCHRPDLRFHYLPGDIKHVPEVPTIVRSRPISDDNANSILLPLNTRRLFEIVHDHRIFRDKIPKLVWRGAVHKAHRLQFLSQCFFEPLCDVGANRTSLSECVPFIKNWLSPEEQLNYKYQFIIEGNDIASNIRWVLNSNSLCLMRRPRYESWFSEGLLKEGYHYVRVADDFSNVIEKIEYYEKNPDEAEFIIQNAHSFVKENISIHRQYAIGRLVMEKYWSLSENI